MGALGELWAHGSDSMSDRLLRSMDLLQNPETGR
jgi:hypothetical protein